MNADSHATHRATVRAFLALAAGRPAEARRVLLAERPEVVAAVLVELVRLVGPRDLRALGCPLPTTAAK